MKRILSAVFVLSCAVGWVQASAQQQADVPTFKSQVNLVNVYTTVVDRRGAPVAGLGMDDFELFEDGIPQKISLFAKESELPLSIVLAIDTSLSTRKDIRLELDAAERFVKSLLRKQDSIAIYQFSEEVRELVPFTSDVARVDAGLKRAHMGAATAMYDAIYLASVALSKRHGRKVLMVITDGGDTVSKVDYAEAVRAAQIADAIVYSIIDVPIEASAGRNTAGEHALIQMSEDTGGRYYYENSPEQLDKAFHEVSEELRTQYLLGFYPIKRSGAADFRRIEVRLKPSTAPKFAGLQVRHRAGYYTSKIE